MTPINMEELTPEMKAYLESLTKRDKFDRMAKKLLNAVCEELEAISEAENLTEAEEDIVLERLKNLL